MSVQVKIEGAKELGAYIKGASGLARLAANQVVHEVSLGIQSEAKQSSPVDTGRTRASIQTAFFAGGLSSEVFVGTEAGLYMDRGTGTKSLDGPNPPYFPPPSALRGWCARHGLAGLEYVIARSIFRKGGLKPRRFFTDAVEAWSPKYVDMMALALGRGL